MELHEKIMLTWLIKIAYIIEFYISKESLRYVVFQVITL